MLGVLAFLAALLAVDVMRLVVDHDKVAPATQQPADRRVRVLPRTALHRAEDSLWNKPSFLERYLALADPILAFRFERNSLPVAHEDVRVELLPVLRRHHLEAVVKIVLAGLIKP